MNIDVQPIKICVHRTRADYIYPPSLMIKYIGGKLIYAAGVSCYYSNMR